MIAKKYMKRGMILKKDMYINIVIMKEDIQCYFAKKFKRKHMIKKV